MKWILYVMLFTTPASNVTNKTEQACLRHDKITEMFDIFACRPNYEGKHIWSLQSTSQLDFSNIEGCVKAQDELIVNSNVASTMTLRTWCFCDSDTQQCPKDNEIDQLVGNVRECEMDPDGKLCKEARPKLHTLAKPNLDRNFVGSGQNATSIQLYPPPPKKNPRSR
jgi:hypothetical protein